MNSVLDEKVWERHSRVFPLKSAGYYNDNVGTMDRL